MKLKIEEGEEENGGREEKKERKKADTGALCNAHKGQHNRRVLQVQLVQQVTIKISPSFSNTKISHETEHDTT
jgi:hypothetical protein